MKTKSAFFCQQCGYETPKWTGKCPSCGAWNSFVEEIIERDTAKKAGEMRPWDEAICACCRNGKLLCVGNQDNVFIGLAADQGELLAIMREGEIFDAL